MSIKFLLDENIPYALIDLLEDKGFTARHLKKMGSKESKMGRSINWQKRTRCGL